MAATMPVRITALTPAMTLGMTRVMNRDTTHASMLGRALEVTLKVTPKVTPGMTLAATHATTLATTAGMIISMTATKIIGSVNSSRTRKTMAAARVLTPTPQMAVVSTPATGTTAAWAATAIPRT